MIINKLQKKVLKVFKISILNSSEKLKTSKENEKMTYYNHYVQNLIPQL
jgi:hypothetical protein